MKKKMESLRYDISVSISAEGITIVDIVIRACTDFCDVIVINFREFDVILAMDWLFKIYASVDCQTKEIVLGIDG